MTTTTTLPLKSLREIAGAAFDSELCSTTSPVLVLFHTPWCGRCRILEPSLARLARKWEGEVSIAKANLDQSPELAARYGIAGTPTLILFCGGAPIACFAGTIAPRQLEPQVRGLLADYAQPTGTAARRRSDRAKPPPLAGPGLAEAAMRTRGPNMKVIGLIGGMSWESTIEYYRHGNVDVRAAAILAATMFAGAWVGAYFANRISGPHLRLTFGLFVRATGVYLVYGACKRLGWI